MKKLLAISILLNLGLAAALICSLIDPQSSLAPVAPQPSPVAAPVLSLTPAPLPQKEIKPFQWSQLESPDYRVYVKNLRAIGCPAQTIRDIIAADVDSLYSVRRRVLQLAEDGFGPWSRWEETQLIAKLTGQTSPATGSTPGTTVAKVVQPVESKPEAVSTAPLYMQDLDLDAAGLDAGQKKAVEELRLFYVNEIHNQNSSASLSSAGGAPDAANAGTDNTAAQNPTDPTPNSSGSPMVAATSAPDWLPTQEDLDKIVGHTAWQAMQDQLWQKTNTSQP